MSLRRNMGFELLRSGWVPGFMCGDSTGSTLLRKPPRLEPVDRFAYKDEEKVQLAYIPSETCIRSAHVLC